MKIAQGPSARLLLWPLYFAIATAGCGRVSSRDISEDGAVLDAAPQIPTARSDAAPEGTPAQADAAAGQDPRPPSDKDAGIGPDPKGAGAAVSTGGCATKDDCGGGLVCSLPAGICVECLVDHDCKGKAKTCDPNTSTCIGCTDDCPNGD